MLARQRTCTDLHYSFGRRQEPASLSRVLLARAARAQVGQSRWEVSRKFTFRSDRVVKYCRVDVRYFFWEAGGAGLGVRGFDCKRRPWVGLHKNV